MPGGSLAAQKGTGAGARALLWATAAGMGLIAWQHVVLTSPAQTWPLWLLVLDRFGPLLVGAALSASWATGLMRLSLGDSWWPAGVVAAVLWLVAPSWVLAGFALATVASVVTARRGVAGRRSRGGVATSKATSRGAAQAWAPPRPESALAGALAPPENRLQSR